jgi:hypothetical protein
MPGRGPYGGLDFEPGFVLAFGVRGDGGLGFTG